MPQAQPRPARRQPITGEDRIVGPGFQRRVYDVVERVPPGCVTTYGDVAAVLGSARVARHVGFALSALEKHLAQTIPWQRVVNAQGRISHRSDVVRAAAQQQLLEAEGIRFSSSGRILDFADVRFVFPAPAHRSTAKKRG